MASAMMTALPPPASYTCTFSPVGAARGDGGSVYTVFQLGGPMITSCREYPREICAFSQASSTVGWPPPAVARSVLLRGGDFPCPARR